MGGAMMRGAHDQESIRIMISALGATLDVMNVHEYPIATAWNHASAAVSSRDMAPHRRRNVLACSGLALGGWLLCVSAITHVGTRRTA